jgi:hypothetical protein
LKKIRIVFLFAVLILVLAACRGNVAEDTVQDSINETQAFLAHNNAGQTTATSLDDFDDKITDDKITDDKITDDEVSADDIKDSDVPMQYVVPMPIPAEIPALPIAQIPDTEPPAEIETLGIVYIGNRNSLIFHLPTCHTLPYEVNRVYMDSIQTALDNGFRACLNCKP